ncbi:hypothetical protein [Enterococcus sp. AZ196]|uniref:hypothetical protein n=1 Tax=Enterococcus sp. AZ196 TaxID=2774659 RepID=UPI003D295DA7
MKQLFMMIVNEQPYEGVAISSPGTVNVEKGVIAGISAIPYIHHFQIRAELEQILGLPVTIWFQY